MVKRNNKQKYNFHKNIMVPIILRFKKYIAWTNITRNFQNSKYIRVTMKIFKFSKRRGFIFNSVNLCL